MSVFIKEDSFWEMVKMRNCKGVIALIAQDHGLNDLAEEINAAQRVTDAAITRWREAFMNDEAPEIVDVDSDGDMEEEVEEDEQTLAQQIETLIVNGKLKKAKKLIKANKAELKEAGAFKALKKSVELAESEG